MNTEIAIVPGIVCVCAVCVCANGEDGVGCTLAAYALALAFFVYKMLNDDDNVDGKNKWPLMHLANCLSRKAARHFSTITPLQPPSATNALYVLLLLFLFICVVLLLLSLYCIR